MPDQSPQAPLALVTDERFADHAPSGFHPERPERLAAALRGVHAAAPAPLRVPARRATDAELLRVHHEAYLERLSTALDAAPQGLLDTDTYFNAHTREAAWRAAGGACALVDALLDGVSRCGALVARPPGHHATPDRAMGFCLLNNVAVAAAHARARGVERVAIVDWDVHHGNGTQDAFYRDPSVLFVSLHESPLYPGTGHVDELGADDGRGYTVNVPLPSGCEGRDYAMVFERLVVPLVQSHRPGLVLVSAGFDAHLRDPLSGMRLDERAYGSLAATLRRAAGDAPVGLVLEGGYDLAALENSLAAALRGLLDPSSVERVAPREHLLVRETLAALGRLHAPYRAAL